MIIDDHLDSFKYLRIEISPRFSILSVMSLVYSDKGNSASLSGLMDRSRYNDSFGDTCHNSHANRHHRHTPYHCPPQLEKCSSTRPAFLKLPATSRHYTTPHSLSPCR